MPATKASQISLRASAIAGPFGRHVAPVEEQPGGTVLRQIARAEIGCEQAKAALAPQVDLPQAVPGGVEALQQEDVAFATRADMSDAHLVDQDLGRLRKTGYGDVLGG